MTMDIFSTGYLALVVESLKRTPAFFLNTFFTQVETSDTETIFFDVEKEGTRRRLAPFVHPLVEGKVVEGIGYETKSFKPAYVKDKRVFDANRPFRRTAGEQIGTGQTITPAQRMELVLRRDMRDQVDMLTRRMEVMAIEAIRTGKETVNMLMPDGNEKTVIVDFGRDANQTINLTGAARWDQAGVKPLNDLEDWAMQTLQLSGSSVRNIVMDPDAWRVFRETSDLEKRLDLRRVQSGQINLGLLPDHIQYKGNDGAFDYWVYADWYYDEGAGDEVVMLPSGTVLGVGDMLGVRHFGAIKDEAAGFQALEYFPKSWVQQDPSVRFLLMQSAPLMVPYRPNAAFAAKVLNAA
jgi:hypothetical protein